MASDTKDIRSGDVNAIRSGDVNGGGDVVVDIRTKAYTENDLVKVDILKFASILYRHKKRGTTYKRIGIAKLQSESPIKEGTNLVIYVGNDGLYARPESEFHDGRFEIVVDQ